MKALFGLRLRDTQTGLKAYKREVLNNVLDKLVVKRFAFDIEILSVAYRLGYKRIFDAPVKVHWDFSKTSIFGLFSNNGVWNFIHDTLAIWYRLKILRYYDNGKKRSKQFDKELNMYINTGGMTDKRQIIIESVNTIFEKIKISPYKEKNDK